MAYQALYRKYRPQTFDELVGQNHIVETLANQIKTGKIVHAYLFTGSRGTGKTSTAKIFARAINCINNKDGSPCNQCTSCKTMNDNTNIDILEIDAASNNRVDEIREIREKVKFAPVSGKYKVYIIDEVHMLTESAHNALLKTLEEPPSHVVFILATTEPQKLPATILSRCIRFDFSLVSVDTLTKHLERILQSEGVTYEQEAVKAIASAGEGSVRDALSIADSVVAFSGGKITLDMVLNSLGLNDNQTMIDLTDALFKKELGTCLEIVDKVHKQGKNMSVFAKELSVHLRNLLVAKTCNNPNAILNKPENIYNNLKQQADKLDQKELMLAMKVFGNIESELRYALNPKILIETAIISVMTGEDLKKN